MPKPGWRRLPAGAEVLCQSVRTLAALLCWGALGNPLPTVAATVQQIDLDGDGIADTATVTQDGAKLQIDFRSSRHGLPGSVVLEVDSSCGPSQVFATRRPGEVAVDSSCTGQGAQVSTRLYRTDGPLGKWCLEREVNGERASVYGTPYPRYNVVRHACGGEPRDVMSHLRVAIASPDSRAALIRQFDEIDAAEAAGLINADNIVMLNDLGYYLEQAQNATAAAIVLAAVREKAPRRTVATLNMADALWALQAQAQARQLYLEYDQQMRAKGLARQIPTRVAERK